MSDEGIVQFGGVFVELKMKEKRIRTDNDIFYQNPSHKSLDDNILFCTTKTKPIQNNKPWSKAAGLPCSWVY